jgi:cytochrome b subunit of formate dehydrogenase
MNALTQHFACKMNTTLKETSFTISDRVFHLFQNVSSLILLMLTGWKLLSLSFLHMSLSTVCCDHIFIPATLSRSLLNCIG